MEGQNPASETPPVTPPPAPATPPPAATIAPPPEPKAPATAPGVYLDPAKFDEITAKLSRLDQIEREAAEKTKAAEERAFQAAVKEADAKKIAEMLDLRLKADAERQAREIQEARARFEAEQKRLADEYARVQNEARAKEQRAKQFAIDKAKGDALGKWADKLAPNAYQQLSKFWDGEFSAREEGNSYAVYSSDGRSADEFVNAALSSDFYANFLKAGSSHGGTARPGANPSAAAPAPPQQQPEPGREFANMGEWALAKQMENRQQFGNSATDLAQPFGLGRGLKVAQ